MFPRSARIRTAAVAAAAAGGCAVAAALAGPAEATTSHPIPTVRIAFSGKVDRMTVTGLGRLGAGRIRFAASAEHGSAGQFGIVSLHRGYSLADYRKDIAVTGGGGANGLKALNHVVAHATFEGGAAGFPGLPSTESIVLPAGSYYLYNDSGDTQTQFREFTLTGAVGGQARPSTFETISALERDRWGVPRPRLPAAGSVTFANRSKQPHFIVLAQLTPGTTIEQLDAYFRGGEKGQPAFATGLEIGTDVLSPGRSFVWTYRAPKGEYALVCFFPDLKTGMDHAAMGMYRIVHLD